MNLTIRKPASPLDWLRIRLLYRRAFPREERKPFAIIRRMHRAGRTDVWLAEQDGRFAGLATTINGPDLILLDYLAIRESQRSRGTGSTFLQGLLSLYEGKGFFLEIEAPDRDDPAGDKLRRMQFYLRNGLEDLHLTVMLFGVRMILMGRACTLTLDEYRAFYRANYSDWAARHILPPDEKED